MLYKPSISTVVNRRKGMVVKRMARRTSNGLLPSAKCPV